MLPRFWTAKFRQLPARNCHLDDRKAHMYMSVDDLSNWGEEGRKMAQQQRRPATVRSCFTDVLGCGGSGGSAHITGHGRHRLHFHQSAFKGCIAAPTPLLPADVYSHLNGCYAVVIRCTRPHATAAATASEGPQCPTFRHGVGATTCPPQGGRGGLAVLSLACLPLSALAMSARVCCDVAQLAQMPLPAGWSAATDGLEGDTFYFKCVGYYLIVCSHF